MSSSRVVFKKKTMLIVAIILCVTLTSIVAKEEFGSSDGRYSFPDTNYTVEEFVHDLTGRITNETNQFGLNIELKDKTFPIDGTLLGTTLKGSVSFQNGKILSHGNITYPRYALYCNRTGYDPEAERYTAANILLSLELTELVTAHNLTANLNVDGVTGTVLTIVKDISIFFVLTHTFETKENIFTPEMVVFDSDQDWSIRPRDLNAYVVEELIKRNDAAKDWYKEDIVEWQKTVLVPLLSKSVDGLTFPVKNY